MTRTEHQRWTPHVSELVSCLSDAACRTGPEAAEGGPNLAGESEVGMRKIIAGLMIAAATATVPVIASAEPPPNGRNCVGLADSAGAHAGGFGQVVSDIATSSPGAIAASLEAFVGANCTRPGPGQ